MKKLIVLFVVGVFMFTSCSKDQEITDWEDEKTELPDTDEWSDEDDDWVEGDSSEDGNDGDGHDHDSSDEGSLTLYEVTGNSINKIKDYDVPDELKIFQQDEDLHQQVWEHVKTFVPLEYRDKISQFEVFHGGGSLAGYVAPVDESDLSKWKFAMAIDEITGLGDTDFGNELTYTTIHEYGHIISLNDEQVDVNTEPNQCDNFHTGEGCSESDSYINKIFDLGWKDIIDQHDYNDSHATYTQYKDRFLTPYAATNPGEDIAEVFTAFVIQSDRPSASNIANQKILALYEYPYLVKLRDDIRNGIPAARLSLLNMNEYVRLIPRIRKCNKH